MGERAMKPIEGDIQTTDEILESINMQPLYNAIEAFSKVWREAAEKISSDAGAIYEAFCQALIVSIDPLIDVVAVALDLLKRAINSVGKRERERRKWRRLSPLKPQPLLFDKRSKIHRCRNTC